MKFFKGKSKIMQPVGGLIGGVGATLLEEHVPIDNSTAKTALIAVAGAGLSAFTKNEIMQGMGAGILGVVGANLYKNFTGSPASTPATAGLPSRNVMLGSPNWIGRRRVAGPEMDPSNGLPASSKVMF